MLSNTRAYARGRISLAFLFFHIVRLMPESAASGCARESDYEDRRLEDKVGV
jgi:hypothetical protein